MTINDLPTKVQDEVKESLTVYAETYVERENGEYRHIVGLALDTRVKAPDFKTFTFKNTDVYTQEQINKHRNALPDFNW